MMNKAKLTLASLAMVALAAALAGCAGSPQVRYYTLTAPLSPSETPPPAVGNFAIDVVSVSVPAQVDQPQLMLRSGSGQLTAQYSERWSSPLPDELRNALSDTLTRQLGVPDIRQLAAAPGQQVWRVQVDVQRFDVSTAGPAVIDATWRVRPLQGGGGGLLCRNRVEVPVAASTGQGLDAVVAAQQKAVVLLGLTIASAVQSQGRQALAASDLVQAPRCTR